MLMWSGFGLWPNTQDLGYKRQQMYIVTYYNSLKIFYVGHNSFNPSTKAIQSKKKVVASHTTLTESISEKYADVAIIANALPL